MDEECCLLSEGNNLNQIYNLKFDFKFLVALFGEKNRLETE